MEQFYSIGMILVMIAIFYFLLIRPENKRKKQAEEMRNSHKKAEKKAKAEEAAKEEPAKIPEGSDNEVK